MRRDVIGWLALVAALVGVIALAYYWWQKKQQEEVVAPPPPPAVEAPRRPKVEAEPAIRHPIEQAQAPEEAEKDKEEKAAEPPKAAPRLPTLAESDGPVTEAIGGAFGGEPISQSVIAEELIRRLVVTIDNLPRRQVPVRLLPVQTPPGRFMAAGSDATLVINPDNYKRYAPFVNLAEAADVRRLVSIYVRFYPLFQQQYEELGYPGKYFNDRVIQAIDNLLATPDVEQPVKLVQPKVMYQYADPELESLSGGQKTLIRMGPENAARLKAKLAEIRRALTGKGPKP